jgi:acyl-CoA dehydrogenase
MIKRTEQSDRLTPAQPVATGDSSGRVWPCAFLVDQPSAAARIYLRDPAVAKLAEFFTVKGLAALKQEDRDELWYADWIEYQGRHKLYASVLSPRQYSSLGFQFDLLKIARFLEVFAYFSPAHGYSLQCTFLGLFPILMSDNEAIKREAVGALEGGGLFALGVSEKEHGADLLGNGFQVTPTKSGRHIATGHKYYIGNANAAAIVTILGKRGGANNGNIARRSLPILIAIRPARASGTFRNVRRIRTFGIRAAFVAEFEVDHHDLPPADIVATGRDAWDAVVGTVTLGKFFLGFGSIGICERAWTEAWAHVTSRMLYGKPVIAMPHIRTMMVRAYARLLAMKLYAYRALDYFQAAGPDDHRYTLYSAVQKAKVSTEGVRVIDLMAECIGAKAFEADTFFEMALRDARLIPTLEGSTHINFAFAAQFIPAYFSRHAPAAPPIPPPIDETSPVENSYLMHADARAVKTVAFPHYLAAYRPLKHIPSVRRFARQVIAFRRAARSLRERAAIPPDDSESSIALGRCFATIAYAQLIAENSHRHEIPLAIVSFIFDQLAEDLTIEFLKLTATPLPAAIAALLAPQIQPRSNDSTENELRFILEWIESSVR